MAPPLLVFDLDGTLVDSAPDLLATLSAILPRHGFRADIDASFRNGIGHGARHLIEYALKRQGAAVDTATIDRLHAAFLDHYGAHICDQSQLFPGVPALLDRFEAAGWTLAVCTNKPEGMSRKLLDAIGIGERFAAICGGDTFAEKKPHPAHLNGTIAAAGGSPQRAVMVGDSITDRDAARAAGQPFVGVTFGYTVEPMQALGPDILLDHYDALAVADAERLLAQPAAVG